MGGSTQRRRGQHGGLQPKVGPQAIGRFLGQDASPSALVVASGQGLGALICKVSTRGMSARLGGVSLAQRGIGLQREEAFIGQGRGAQRIVRQLEERGALGDGNAGPQGIEFLQQGREGSQALAHGIGREATALCALAGQVVLQVLGAALEIEPVVAVPQLGQ